MTEILSTAVLSVIGFPELAGLQSILVVSSGKSSISAISHLTVACTPADQLLPWPQGSVLHLIPGIADALLEGKASSHH